LYTGLIFTQGPLWEEQRRFTVRHLRDLGFGKTSIENQIKDEINELIKEMLDTAHSDPDGVVDFKGLFSISSCVERLVVFCRWKTIQSR